MFYRREERSRIAAGARREVAGCARLFADRAHRKEDPDAHQTGADHVDADQNGDPPCKDFAAGADHVLVREPGVGHRIVLGLDIGIQDILRALMDVLLRGVALQIVEHRFGQVGVQHLRVAAAHALVDVVDDAALVIVCDDRAAEAPFVAQNLCQQAVVAARPAGADAVERAHHPVGLALLHGDLKRAQIDLAHRLFGDPGHEPARVARRLLLVDGEVLQIRDDALLAQALDLFRREFAGEVAVLAVILPVAAAERRAMDVDRGRVPAGVRDVADDRLRGAVLVGDLLLIGIAGERLVADRLPEAVQKIGIPRAGEHDLRRIGAGAFEPLAEADHEVHPARRAVRIPGLALADGVNADRLEAAVVVQAEHLVRRDAVEQLVPALVVVVRTLHVRQHRADVGGDGLFRVDVGRRARLGRLDGGERLLRKGALLLGGRSGPRPSPIGTGQKALQMVVRVVKAVDHGRARHGVVLIADVLGERHRKDLARVVRVLRDGEVVVARVQLVAAEAVFVGVVIVIRGEIIRVDLDGVYNAKKPSRSIRPTRLS